MQKKKIIRNGEHTVRLIEDTKRFFAKRENKKLIHQIRVITTDGFGINLKDMSLAEIREHIIDVDVCALGYVNNELAGFASARLLHELDILFLYGIVILADVQTKGAGSKLLSNLIGRYNKCRIAFTTQNPVMYDLLAKFCQNIIPSLERSSEVPEWAHEIGYKLMEDREGVFDSNTFITQNLYTKCRYKQIPRSKDPLVNRWFDESLEIRDGLTLNGVLMIGEVKELD